MKTKKYFLWPEPHSLSFHDFFHKESIYEVEQLMQEFWPDTYPVLFSSARSGLTAILQYLNLRKDDLVWCPPYSSHCVIESIARVSTPTTSMSKGIKAALIYHQWGFSSSHEWSDSVTIIEDSVDTIFIPNTNIFSAGGRFSLQSLPKVYGSIFGGVVFCRNFEDARSLIDIRNNRGVSNIQNLLRIISLKNNMAHSYWHGVESLHGGLQSIGISQIRNKLESLSLLVDNRLDFLEKISKSLYENTINSGRIPSNLPLVVTPYIKKKYSFDSNFSSGLRFFNIKKKSPNGNWKLVAPMPLHIGVNYDELCELLPSLKYKIKSEVQDEFGFL